MTQSDTPHSKIIFADEQVRNQFLAMLQNHKTTLAQTLGMEFISVARDRLEARMPVDHRTIQPLGLLHGGASVALAETLASVGGFLNVNPEENTVVGIEINANHINAARNGWVNGIAQPIKRGRTLHVWRIQITDESQRLICESRCTLAVIKRR